MLSLVFSCGTLGGFDTIDFGVSKQQLSQAIDSLYVIYPRYQIPSKWQKFDNWKERGYDFLDSRIFYFEAAPEEMYYVTFVGDSLSQSASQISIRAVSQGSGKWLLQDDFTDRELNRIESRFESEILSKLKYHHY